ncbi:hypothetical protein QE152_g25721 [Popillia japonica]|uniref:Uncharacterized protein n=1 Tax=Popillia japonica TaxID=7064 RepID=A0AAW1K0Q4_POPJA
MCSERVIRPVRKFKITNSCLDPCHEFLQAKCDETQMGHSANEKIKNIIELIQAAAELSFKKNVPFTSKRKSSPPWWDDECNQMVNQRKIILAKYKFERTLENYIKWKEAQVQI